MMRPLVLFVLLLCVGCERAASTSRDTSSSSTALATKPTTAMTDSSVTYALDDTTPTPYIIAGTDSAFGAWGAGGMDISPGQFYIASHVRHPSGLMVIWFDTAIRATEDHPVGRVHTDSVVVTGVKHLEYVGRFCFLGDSPRNGIVGLVQEGDALFHPRLAWRFNTNSLRIEPFPADSARCRVTDPLEGEVD